MKKTIIPLSALAVLALVACNQGQSSSHATGLSSSEQSSTSSATSSASSSSGEAEATIKLYDAESRFVIMAFDDQGSIKLPTYRSSKTGEVPYSELGEFFYANGALGNTRTKVTKVDQVYKVQLQEGDKTLFSVDPSKDTFTVENYAFWSGLGKRNNGIGPDIASPDDSKDGAVQGSDKTKVIGTVAPEVYDAKKYGFDFVESEGKCYAPTTLLSNFFYRWTGVDLAYNGFDYYMSSAITGAIPVISRSFYSTNKKFAAQDGIDAIAYDPIGEESYRFAYPVKELTKTVYRIMSLTKDHKGQLLQADSPTEKGTQAKIDDITYSYEWEQKGDFLYVTIIASGKSVETGEPETAKQGIQKIPLKDGLYGKKTRSKEVIDFNYKLLRFQFEKFYGIKDVAGITTFDDYVSKKNVKDGLMSADAETYDKALATLLMTDIDDGHTRYSTPSLYSGSSPSKGQEYAKEYAGSRYKGLLSKYSSYVDQRRKAMGFPEKTPAEEGQGLFIKNNTAVIRFDEFSGPGSIVSNAVTPEEVKNTDPLAAIKGGNVPLGFDSAFYQLSQLPKEKKVDNVVIDLTCNSGGQIKVLPYLLAHFTDDPYLRYKDECENVFKEYHYKVDLNHDGVYGGEGDTHKGKYKFFILTSDFSFSCANFLPTMAKEIGVKIIGLKSGGGAAAVGGFADACGSTYNLSSPSVCVTKSGDSYVNNDAGVPVDYELEASSWYDLTKLDAFVNAH